MPVTVEGIARAPQLCLLDTGALHNRFAAWVADAAGIDLTAADEERFAVGGFVAAARWASVQLTLGEVTWESPVWFCDPGRSRSTSSAKRDSSAGSTFAFERPSTRSRSSPKPEPD